MNPKVTLVGRLGADPESVGASGVRLRVVTSDRAKNDKGEWEDRDTSWWTVKAWKTLAEQTKKTLKKGQEVMITGTIYQESWTDNDGKNKTSYEVVADSVGLTAYTITKQPMPAMSSSTSESPWN